MIIHWIWLTQLPFIGSVTARRLIEKLGDAEKIYQAGSEQLAEISDLSVRQRESIIRNHSLEKAKRIFEECQNKNISFYAGMMTDILHVQRNRLMHLWYCIIKVILEKWIRRLG